MRRIIERVLLKISHTQKNPSLVEHCLTRTGSQISKKIGNNDKEERNIAVSFKILCSSPALITNELNFAELTGKKVK